MADVLSQLLGINITEVSLYLYLILLVVVAVYIAESKKLTYSIGAFAIYGIVIGLIFIALGSPLLAAIQVLVFSGTISILMLAIISLGRGEEIVET